MDRSESERKSSQVLLCAGGDVDYELIVQIYDVQEDEWYPEINIEDARFQYIVPFKDKFCIATSHYDDSGEDNFELKIRSYDLLTKESDTDTYPLTNDMGKPIGTHGSYIYFMCEFTKTLSRFNWNDNTIEERIAELNESHERNGIAFLNDRLYILGVDCANYKESDCEVYDTKTNEVKSIAPYPADPINRQNRLKSPPGIPLISATEFNGKLYTMEEHTLRYLYVYSPEKEEWETIINKYPPAIYCGCLVNCGGKLICVDRMGYVHLYDPETNSWESRTDYNGSMSYLRSVTVIEKPTINN